MPASRVLLGSLVALSSPSAFYADDETPLSKQPRNLDFESPLSDGGWTTGFDGKAEFDESTRHAGARAMRISGPATRIPAERALTQEFDAGDWRGKRVQVTGWARWDRSRIGVFVNADGVMDYDSDAKRLPAAVAGEATTAPLDGWKRLAARVDVPYDAESIVIGARVYLEAEAPVWIDDLRFEVCPDQTSLFDPKRLRANFTNLDFEWPTAEGERPAEWLMTVAEVGDPFDDDYENSVYEFVRDTGSHVTGSACARLAHTGGPAGGVWIRQKAGAAPWRGKTVRFAVFLRADGASVPPEGPFLTVHSEDSDRVEGELRVGHEQALGVEARRGDRHRAGGRRDDHDRLPPRTRHALVGCGDVQRGRVTRNRP
ncbi:MAG: hypothetical protein EXS13_06330 [Planctomycetes bacterium]|nr:hypothetical protein [Planctomycetota bacterium]